MTGQDDAGRAIFDPRAMALRGRIGGYTISSRHNPTETTAKARATYRTSFERMVDPDGKLSPKERARRAEAARHAHYHKLSYLAAKKRREKSAARSVRTEATPSEVDDATVRPSS